MQTPEVFMKLVDIYLAHFYGHCLWDLSSKVAEGLWRTWNVTVRTVLDLPFATHRYILEQLCSSKHIKLRLFKRFLNFKERLQCSQNSLVINLLNAQRGDMRSTFSRNCETISSHLHNSDSVYPVPDNSDGKLNLIRELLDIKSGEATLTGLTRADTLWILQDICSN